MKALIISDLHIRESIRIYGTEIKGDCEYSIQQVLQYLELLKPDYMIIAGDIFNQRKVLPEEVSLYCDLIKGASDILNGSDRILTIQGNHDRGEDSLSGLLGCTDLDRDSVILPDLVIRGQKFKGVDSAREFLKTSGTGTVTVIHVPCKPFSSFGTDNISPEDFPEGIAIVGDTHLSQLWHEGNKYILSPGCLYPNNAEELKRDNSTGAWLLDTDSSDKFMELEIRKRKLFDLSCMTNPEEELSHISVSGETFDLPPVVYINAKGPSVNPEPCYILIPVITGTDDKPLLESLEMSAPIMAKVETIVTTLMGDDPDTPAVSHLVAELIQRDDSRMAVNDFITQETTNVETDAD